MYQCHFHFATTRYSSTKTRRPNKKSVRNNAALALLAILITSTLQTVIAKEQIVRSMSEIESGTLLLVTDSKNHYQRAPLVETSVSIGVAGLLARTSVEQQFSNTSTDWVEGIYAFPLPDNATVDALTMIIGESVVEGSIQPREKAKANYEAAKATGRKASLLEQQRPNLFTTRVANIPPGESITIKIAYQSSVRYVDGQFSLFFPLTITPRYNPARTFTYDKQDLTASTASGWTTVEQLQEAAAISPPMSDIASTASITVSLDTGLNDLTVQSSTHDIITTKASAGTSEAWHVSLANPMIKADRDFKLSWTPPPFTAPVAAVFRQDKFRLANDSQNNNSQEDNNTQDHTESFASIMVMPPQQIYSDTIPSREVLFVIDTSQSMSGNSIRQARRMLTLGIERLSDTDFFNVIAFNNTSRKFFRSSVPATNENKTRAISQVQNLSANGGTEILGALQSALRNKPVEQSLQQIVFITDGSVGNENEIFHYLHKNIGKSRLFTVGIGSAPNTWFMRKSAELGKGTYTSIANTSELVDKALTLLAKLEQPAITDITIKFNTDKPPEVYPAIMPDVYMGEPLLADARWPEKITEGDIEITGSFAGQIWSQTIKLGTLSNSVASGPKDQGLDKLWAYKKIAALEDSLLFNNDFDHIKEQITDIALDYSIVTQYTSLVAIENKVSRDPASKTLHSAAAPQTMPAGNTMHYPQGSLGTTIRFIIALLVLLLALWLRFARRRVDTSVVCTPLKTKIPSA